MPTFVCVFCNVSKSRKKDKWYKYHEKYGWPKGKEKPIVPTEYWKICKNCYKEKTSNQLPGPKVIIEEQKVEPRLVKILLLALGLMVD